MKKGSNEYSFLVISDLGEDADYTKEVRSTRTLRLDFVPSEDCTTGQIKFICRQIGSAHIWLLDDNGMPTLFVSGMLTVRESAWKRKEVESLNEKLLPQVTEPQISQSYRFLVRSAWALWTKFENSDQMSESEFDEALRQLERSAAPFHASVEVQDNYWGPEDSILFVADLWHTAVAELLFDPNTECSQRHLSYIAYLTVTYPPWKNVVEEECICSHVWLLDAANRPVRCVTGADLCEYHQDTANELLDEVPDELLTGDPPDSSSACV